MSKYVVLDLEMCKVPKRFRKEFNHYRETIQIGAVLLDETYEIIDRYMAFVNPKYGIIDSEIRRLTGIRYNNVNNAPKLMEMVEHMMD